MLLEVSLDPDYQPDRDNEASDDDNSPPGQLGRGLALHSMPVDAVGVKDVPESSDHYGSMEESESGYGVRKRRHISIEEFKDTLAKSEPWLEIQVPVCVINLDILNVVYNTE